MPPPFQKFDGDAFRRSVRDFDWTRRIWRVDMHHTWFPAHRDYRGLASIEAMHRYHVNDLGWDDIAQHVSIAPDGAIWTGRDWNKRPASVGGSLNHGVFMFEVIGNFNNGHDQFAGLQRDRAIHVIAVVQQAFALPVQAMLFHREVPITEKTCPGTSVDKSEVMCRVRDYRASGQIAVA